MEISFTELKNKEIINVYDGRKLGRVVDLLFDNLNGSVKGIVVPGEKRMFRRNDDIFVPLEKLKKIGDDVILVNLPISVGSGIVMQNARYNCFDYEYQKKKFQTNTENEYKSKIGSFVRYKRIAREKYK